MGYNSAWAVSGVASFSSFLFWFALPYTFYLTCVRLRNPSVTRVGTGSFSPSWVSRNLFPVFYRGCPAVQDFITASFWSLNRAFHPLRNTRPQVLDFNEPALHPVQGLQTRAVVQKLSYSFVLVVFSALFTSGISDTRTDGSSASIIPSFQMIFPQAVFHFRDVFQPADGVTRK